MKWEPDTIRESTGNIVIPFTLPGSDNRMVLLGNVIEGRVSILNESEYEIFQTISEDTDESLLSALLHEGYLTTCTQEQEEQQLIHLYESRKQVREPRAVFVVTYACNFRCTYCWSEHLFTPHSKWMNTIMNKKTIDAAIEALDHIPALENLNLLSLYGGEPFLPSTRHLVEYIMNTMPGTVAFQANTNGYYLKEFVPLLAEHDIAGLGVTLDGMSSVHNSRRKQADGSGTFQQIVEGIDAALDEGIPVGVRINVDRDNISHLPEFGQWIKDHGWTHRKDISFEMTPVRPGKDNHPPALLTYTQMCAEIINLLHKECDLLSIIKYQWEYMKEGYLARAIADGTDLTPRPFYCSAHIQAYIFDPLGNIYTCPRAVGDEAFSIGRFIPEVHFNDHVREWKTRHVLAIDPCMNCEYALVCGGGCAYEASLAHNTLQKGHCERFKAFIEYGLPLYVKWRLNPQEGYSIGLNVEKEKKGEKKK